MTKPIAEYDITPQKFVESIKPWAEKGNLYGVSVHHDDGCPCIEGKSFRKYCTCELIHVVVVKL